MPSDKQKNARMVVLFLVGVLLFHYPILSLFSNKETEIAGIPLLFVYVFGAWLALICLTAVIVRVRKRIKPSHSDSES